VLTFVPPEKTVLGPVCGGAVKTTVTPVTGLPPESVTSACSGCWNALLTVAACPLPPAAEMAAGGPGVFVRENAVVAVVPGKAAITWYLPALLLVVKIADVTIPWALLTPLAAPLGKLPPGPEAGGLKVTTTPETGFPPASATLTTNGAAKGVEIAVLCPEPLSIVIDTAAAAVLLSENTAVVLMPDAEAVTA
jgi:hypothetical protein